MAGHPPDQQGGGPAGLQAGEGGHRPEGRQAGPVRRRVRRVQLHDLRQERRGPPRQGQGGHGQRAAVLLPPVLPREQQGLRQHNREPGDQVQPGPERGGPGQDQGAGRRDVHRRGEGQDPRGRGDPRPGVVPQEALLRQDHQPVHRQDVRRGQGRRGDRRQGHGGRGWRVHVLHMRIRPQVRCRQGARQARGEDGRLRFRAQGRHLVEVPQ